MMQDLFIESDTETFLFDIFRKLIFGTPFWHPIKTLGTNPKSARFPGAVAICDVQVE